jgi:hypothetical protein
MANIQEKTSFDNAPDFTGKDLDVSWAYLQVKTLWELEVASGNETITPNNFRDKVLELLELNKTAGIAEDSSEDVYTLPGRLSFGLPLGTKQINFQKRWTLNDMWNSHETNNRSSRKPNDVWESIGGELAGTLENFTWTDSKTADANLNYMGNDAKVSLVDGKTIRSDKSWTLHFRMQSKSKFDGTLFTKGLDTSDWNVNPFFQVVVFRNAKSNGVPDPTIGIYTQVGVKNWFKFPTGMAKNAYDNKLIDFYFVREGQNARMFIDDGSGPKECDQAIPGAIPELLDMTNISAPLEFGGNIMSYLEDVWIADNEFIVDDLPYTDKPATRFRFAHDLNLTTSYYAWKNLFQDKYGNYGQIFDYSNANKPYAGTANEQTHWTTDNTSDGKAFGWQERARVLKLDSSKKALQVNNVNFNSNFTVSFWVRTDATSQIVKFVGQNDTFVFQQKSNKTHFRLKYDGNNKDLASSTLSANPLNDTWYHITLVKNRNLIGMWVNGQIGDYDFVGLTDAQIQAIGWSNLEFRGDDANPVYYSDVRVLDYALCNIPVRGYGKQSTYDFTDTLKQSQSSSY